MLVFVETHTVVVGVGRQTRHTLLFWDPITVELMNLD